MRGGGGGLEHENLLLLSLVSVKTPVDGSDAGDARAFTSTSARARAVVVVRCCPPTGYLHREPDIKRDR